VIRDVHAAAFGRSAEGRLADRLRNDGLVVASIVAVVNTQVVGNIVFSSLPIQTRAGALRDVEGSVTYPDAFAEVD
jgi:predicted N-acetyltransferase YhbS